MKLRYRARLFWNRLWIRKDEFHSTLSFDAVMYADLTPAEQTLYMKDLCRRRTIAHDREMA